MKILVTGGTGFIGSHLVDRLLGMGYEVVVPVRKKSTLRFLSRPAVQTRLADMTERDDVEDIVEDVDVIFHLAGIRGSGWSFTDEQIQSINVGITGNLLNSSLGRVKHFIYISSVSVQGHFRGGPADEDYPCIPLTRYGMSKYEAEKLVDAFHMEKELPTTIIRPVITYGPRDIYGMVAKLIRLINSGKYFIVGSGDNRVHLVYINDLIDGLLRTMLNPIALGRTYILAGEAPVTINRAVDIISTLLNKSIHPIHVPIWLAKATGLFLEKFYSALSKKNEPFITRDKVDIVVRDRFFSINRAKKELGYTPVVHYEEGLKKTVVWLREQRLI